MKRCFLLAILTISFAIIAVGQNATVISENANLRGTAGLSGKIVQVVPNNTSVEVIKQKGPWFLVQTYDYVGWMHGNSLRIDGAASIVRSNDATRSVAPVTISQPLPERGEESVQPPTDEPNPTIIIESSPIDRSLLKPLPTQSEAVAPSTEPVKVATGSCVDGTLTYSKTKEGACSGHGGVSFWSGETPTQRTEPSISTGPKTVQVRGYTRKDGTYVAPHTRRAPRKP